MIKQGSITQFYVLLQVENIFMNLTIDIGNSAAKLVVFNHNQPIYEEITSNKTLAAIPALLSKYPCEKGIYSSVIRLNEKTKKVLGTLPIPIIGINQKTPIPIKNLYETPETLGSDRLASVIGATTLKPEKDLLVIDSGTCITYEFVDSEGRYMGGNISPGIHLRLKSLHEHTSLLPSIEANGEIPEIGFNTETAIRSGVIQGIQFEMEGYIRSFLKKYPNLLVFLTGGDCFDFDNRIKNIIFADKYLVPRGLNRILEYNDKK